MASSFGWTLFPTAIGSCGIAWVAGGIVSLKLPADTPDETAASLGRHANGPSVDPPGAVAEAITRIRALLDGGDADLTSIAIDLSRRPAFDQQVLAVTRAIPRGATRTYGAIATELGDPLLARDVGQALGHNPIPVIVPCHRVLGTDERLVGFSAPGGLATKRRLLAIEGVYPGGKSLFDHFGVETA